MSLRELCFRDLFFLSEFVLRNRESEPIELDREYHGEMCDWLMKKKSRKILLAPRGHLKSSIANRNYIIWRIIKNSNITFLIVSATLDNSIKKLRAIQEIFERNETFRWLFPEIIPKNFNENWTQKEMLIPRSSSDPEYTVEVQGAEGELTSRHYKIILMDDIVGKENSSTSEQIKKIINFYTQSLQLLKKPHGEILLIGTLWDFGDLYNHVLEKLYKHYDILVRSIWRDDKYLKSEDNKYAWTAGKQIPLYPAMFNNQSIAELKTEIIADPLKGRSTWMAQYELKIVDDKNAIFKRSQSAQENFWFTEDDLWEKKLAFSLSCDPAISESKQADDTAFIVRAIDDLGFWYFIEVYGKIGMREEDIVDMYIHYLTKYPIDICTIETIAFQKNIKYALEKKCLEEKVFFPYMKLPGGYDQASKLNSDLKIRGLSAPYSTGKLRFKKDCSHTEKLLDQLWRFPKSPHDDYCLVGDTKVATIFGNKKIKDIKIGDYVITPIGIKKVLNSWCSGKKEIFYNRYLKLKGTSDHPIFTENRFAFLDTIEYNEHISKLTIKSQLIWAYKTSLYSMAKNTNSWEGKKDIISVSQTPLKDEKILKDCMSQFGNFIIKKKFQKGIAFIIKTATLLIMTLVIWNVYRVVSILNYIGKIAQINIKKLLEKILKLREKKQRNGINQKQEESGIRDIIKKVLQKLKNINIFASIAEKVLRALEKIILNIVPIYADRNIYIKQENYVKIKNVLNVEKYTKDLNIETQNFVQENAPPQLNGKIKRVYNLTIQDANCFYANGILVGNCDCAAQNLHLPIIATKVWKSKNEIKPNEIKLGRYGEKIDNNKKAGMYI